MQHLATSDLVLYCLQMSHEKEARLIWVKAFASRADPEQAALSGSTLFAHVFMIYVIIHKWT